MNVLVLTPDRVGSTLLQRLITVYMAADPGYDRPVINLHELTNGLLKYYNESFGREVLGKPNFNSWGYYQTLPEILELLSTTDHYKTARLTHYHIRARNDSIADQVPFYQYLNDNFYIISARRDNLLEHGLSWCIQNESKRLNVYSHQEKLEIFQRLYRNRITVNLESFRNYLGMYRDYLAWVDQYFRVNSVFHYDRHMTDLETYIRGLNIWPTAQRQTWADIFGIDFETWNRCHYLLSDLSGIGQQLPGSAEQLKLTWSGETSDLALHSVSQEHIPATLTQGDQQLLVQHGQQYRQVSDAISELVERKVMVTGVPIKLQTLLEKRLLIENFDQVVAEYNELVTSDTSGLKGCGPVYNHSELNQISLDEIRSWHVVPKLTG